MKKLKLLPVFLIVVAVAFSIRIGDIAMRVSDLSIKSPGAAFAETGHAEPEGEYQEPSSEVFGGEFGIPEDDFSSQESFFEEDGLDPAEFEILQDLAARREELDKRENQIEQKEALLKAAEQQIDQKLTELTKIRDEIKKLLGEQEEKETKRIQSLVKVYEGMRPNDAANIFNELELSILLPVVENMSERKLSPILAAMSPDRARIITRRMAEKVQLPKLPEDQQRFDPRYRR